MKQYQSIEELILEEANDLSEMLGKGRRYHGAEKHSSDWHDGWEECAKSVEQELRSILAQHHEQYPEKATREELLQTIKDHDGSINFNVLMSKFYLDANEARRIILDCKEEGVIKTSDTTVYLNILPDTTKEGILALFIWRDKLTDRYGDDLISLLSSDFCERNDHTDKRVPDEHWDALKSFRGLPFEQQEELIEEFCK